MPLRFHLVNWLLFIALCFIWGSSFILMKVGLDHLNAYQVAALRLASAGILLLPVAVKNFQKIARDKLPLILLSGLLGSFFPAFLFCIAETRIDSALTGILNAVTPIFTIILAALFFQMKMEWKKTLGILVSFTGLCLLMLSKGAISTVYLSYGLLVVLATVFYALNVNMVSKHLKDVGSLNIAATAFAFLTVPSLLILIYTGFFRLDFSRLPVLLSMGASSLLGIAGTAIASILFYMLVKRAGILFTSLVTYGIPFVALFWGFVNGELISMLEIGCLSIILAGVFLTNK